MSGALVGALTRTRKALGIALLALTPSNPTFSSGEAVGMRTETLFQEASRSFGFNTLHGLKHPEDFKPGYGFEYGGDVWDAKSLCQDCCDGISLDDHLDSDELHPLKELKRELVSSFSHRSLLSPLSPLSPFSPYLMVKFDDEVSPENVSRATLTLRDFRVKRIGDETVKQYLEDPVCIRSFRGPKRTWVVTETLEATPMLILNNAEGEPIEIPEGAEVTIRRHDGNAMLRITPNESVVIGFNTKLFIKKRLNRSKKKNAQGTWQDRYEDCEEKHEDYCEAVESVEARNAECREQLAHHPGFLRVILTPPEDRWVPSDKACRQLTWRGIPIVDEDLPHHERRRVMGNSPSSSLPSEGPHAVRQTIEIKPDQESRFTEENSRIEVIEGPKGGWGFEGREERSPVSAQITIVAYDDAIRTMQYCVPQETLQRANVPIVREYEFDGWEEEFQIPIPSDRGWRIETEVVYLGNRVDGPQIGIQRGGGPVNLSTPQLQNVDLEIRQETGEHVYTYKVLPPCEFEALPEFPEECINCGQWECPGE